MRPLVAFTRRCLLTIIWLQAAEHAFASPSPSVPPDYNATDREFMTATVSACLFQVALGFLAQTRGDEVSRHYGQTMVGVHERWAKEVRLLGFGMGVPPLPNALTLGQRETVERLRHVTAENFDDAYAQEAMASHHQMVDSFEHYLKDSSAGEIKQWSSRTLADVRRHLSAAESLAPGRVRAKEARLELEP